MNWDNVSQSEIGKKPDILNVPQQIIYEIKPFTRQREARNQAFGYINSFQKAGIRIQMGNKNDSGTLGAFAYNNGNKNGLVVYAAPENGVILYRYLEGKTENDPIFSSQNSEEILRAMQITTGVVGLALILQLLLNGWNSSGGLIRKY